jgi:hypothetical protein
MTSSEVSEMRTRTTVLATPLVLPFLDRIIHLKRQFWNYPAASQRRWFFENVGENDLHVIAYDDEGTFEGYTRIALEAEADCGVIDTMCVRKDLQGRGIGLIVMQAANRAILNEGRTGLLSCRSSLTPFYAHCGWRCVESPLLRPDEVTMQLSEMPLA